MRVSNTSELSFELDGQPVTVAGAGSLLSVLREELGVVSVKDGCSPQGQCGCCTVLVDGAPRVACVTPARRVNGRSVTTLDGLDDEVRDRWAAAFCATGASQCGFCTPGIIVRLDGERTRRGLGTDQVNRALHAHLCRCTGWQTIHEAVAAFDGARPSSTLASSSRDLAAAARRAEIEGGTAQVVGPEVALGHGGFADDTAPAGSLVAVPDSEGGWAVGDTLDEARAAAGTVQGRRTTLATAWPLDLPDGDWAATLRTTWCEPAPLEPDASWCVPGGEPVSPSANGGDFGAKRSSIVTAAARTLADEHGRPVRVVLPREWVVRYGPKRPPIAAGITADGAAVVRAVATEGLADRLAEVAPGVRLDEVEVPGPRTSLDLRAVGWAETELLQTALRGSAAPVISPDGARAEATVAADGTIQISLACGPTLDEIVLRSFAIGAAHMAMGWVTSEALTVDDTGEIHDLTIRSFGVLRAVDTPPIEVTIEAGGPDDPVRGSDAVFVAVANAVFAARGCPQDIPILS